MQILPLKNAIEGFIAEAEKKIRYNKIYGKVDLRQALLKKPVKDNASAPSLLEYYLDRCEEDNLYLKTAQSTLMNSMDDLFYRYTHDKNKLNRIYSDFIKHLEDAADIHINHIISDTYIPATTLEKQIAIIKMLHKNEMTSVQIAGKLHMTQASALEYLNTMQSDKNTEGLVIDRQKVKIHFNKKTTKYYLDNTVHPLVLALNLNQVIAMLEGLRVMDASGHGGNAYALAKNIWNQLSDYGHNQIEKQIDPLGLDARWYEALKTGDAPPPYQTERDFYLHSKRASLDEIIYLMKVNRLADITYIDGKDEKVLWQCKFIRLLDGRKHVEVQHNGTSMCIPIEAITSILEPAKK